MKSIPLYYVPTEIYNVNLEKLPHGQYTIHSLNNIDHPSMRVAYWDGEGFKNEDDLWYYENVTMVLMPYKPIGAIRAKKKLQSKIWNFGENFAEDAMASCYQHLHTDIVNAISHCLVSTHGGVMVTDDVFMGGWPLKDVLNTLINASEKLLHRHGYDGNNHEEILICVNRAKQMVAFLDKLLIKSSSSVESNHIEELKKIAKKISDDFTEDDDVTGGYLPEPYQRLVSGIYEYIEIVTKLESHGN